MTRSDQGVTRSYQEAVKMANTVVDVFCENYVLVDWEAHALWIAGHGVTEAVALMREKGIMNEYPGVTQDLLVSDLNDQGSIGGGAESVALLGL